MIQSFIAHLPIVHQNQTACGIIDNLDSAVKDEVFTERIHAEVHRAGCTGAPAEIRFRRMTVL